ncbi:MAG TPA: calcium/sodium antiporter [Thermoanaerobaculia bacterium]|nr:calcium/sodium antiporter [Thermoanaerobaculia bacterium]
MASSILLVIAGILVLLGGAELLVRGASRLALTAGISPLVVGLTVVAFGTSTPELAVSVRAALGGAGGADIALGNVIGSNTANVLLILGLSALIAPLGVSRQLVRLDVPIMVACSLLLMWMAADGELGRPEGVLLLAGIVVYTASTIVRSRKESAPAEGGGATRRSGRRLLTDGGLVIAGLVGLIAGASWLVDGAVVLAQALGVGELIVGLTVVAVGTSLPELATSALAAWRGERDIAVGNVVGSNIFNILCVLGASALSARGGLEVSPQARAFDLPVMLAVAVLCLPIFFTGFRISRLEGSIFLGLYVVYVVFLVLFASGDPNVATLRAVVVWGVAPTAAVVLGIASLRQGRRERTAPAPTDDLRD